MTLRGLPTPLRPEPRHEAPRLSCHNARRQGGEPKAKAGDLPNAVAAMRSDLATHPETADHPRIRLGKALLMRGHLGDRETCRRWIEGFN